MALISKRILTHLLISQTQYLLRFLLMYYSNRFQTLSIWYFAFVRMLLFTLLFRFVSYSRRTTLFLSQYQIVNHSYVYLVNRRQFLLLVGLSLIISGWDTVRVHRVTSQRNLKSIHIYWLYIILPNVKQFESGLGNIMTWFTMLHQK